MAEEFEKTFEVILAHLREVVPMYQDLLVSFNEVKFLHNDEQAIGTTDSGLVVLVDVVTKLSKKKRVSDFAVKGAVLCSNEAMVLVHESYTLHFIEISTLYSVRSLRFKQKYGFIEKVQVSLDENFIFCMFSSGKFLKVENSDLYTSKSVIKDVQVVDFAVTGDQIYVGMSNRLALFKINLEIVHQRSLEINSPYKLAPSSTSKYFICHNKFLLDVYYKNKLERITRISEETEILSAVFTNDDKYILVALNNSSVVILSSPKATQLLRIPFEAEPTACLYVPQDQSKILLVSGQKLISVKFPKRSKLVTYFHISESDITLNSFINSNKEISFHIGSSANIRFTLPDDKKSYFLSGHEDIVTCAKALNDTICVSGSKDHNIRLWDYRVRVCIGILQGHIAQVSCLEVHRDLLYSGSFDNTIKVWNWHDCTLYHTINLESEVLDLVCWKDALIVAVPGRIYVWDVRNYALIAYKSLHCEVECVKLEYEGKKLMVNATKRIFIRNPLWKNRIAVWGDGGGYTFMNHLDAILSGHNPVYNTRLNSFAIFPHRINILHFYAFFGMLENTKQALTNACALFSSYTDTNPITLARETKNLQTCSLIFHCANQFRFYPLQFKMLSMDEIIQINQSGIADLKNLYELIWTESITTFPKYSNPLETFPKVFNSNVPTILSLNFFEDLSQSEAGIELSYFSSVNKMPEIGTWTSVKFLESLPKENKKLFASDFIEQILLYKWSRCKWVLFVQALLYLMYFLQIIGSIIWIGNYQSLIVANVLGGLVTFFMLVKLVLTASLTGWHITDIFRTLLLIVYTIENFTQIRDEIEFVLILVVLLSTVQGLYYFALFSSTRLLIKSVIKSFFKIFSLVFVMVYLLLTLFLVLSSTGYSIAIEKLEILDNLYLIIAMLFIFCLILSLASYKYNMQKDLIEINYLLIEIEKIMFWQRVKNKEKYFQVCKPVRYYKLKREEKSIRRLEGFDQCHSEIQKKLKGLNNTLEKILSIKNELICS